MKQSGKGVLKEEGHQHGRGHHRDDPVVKAVQARQSELNPQDPQ